jgi:hypothetical protein
MLYPLGLPHHVPGERPNQGPRFEDRALLVEPAVERRLEEQRDRLGRSPRCLRKLLYPFPAASPPQRVEIASWIVV